MGLWWQSVGLTAPLDAWSSGTAAHMAKAEWKATCQRSINRLDHLRDEEALSLLPIAGGLPPVALGLGGIILTSSYSP